MADGVMFGDLRVPSLIFFFAHELILLSSINSELEPSADTRDGLHLSATLPG